MATTITKTVKHAAETLICEICLEQITPAHHYVPYIPRGYGDNKLIQTEGVMHARHLSTSDLLDSKIQKKVA